MSDFDLERRSPFTNAIALVRRDPASFLVASALYTLVEMIATFDHFTFAVGLVLQIVIPSYIACHAHRNFLLGERISILSKGTPETRRALLGMFLRLLVITLCFGAFGVVVSLLSGFIFASPLTATIVAAVISLGTYGLFVVTFGTMIPDIALGGQGHMKDARRWSRGQRRVIIGRMLLYPIGIGVGLQLGLNMVERLGVPSEIFDRATGEITWLAVPLDLAFSACAVFFAYMVAAILSRAYQVGGGMDELRASEGP